jgi:hypothetical protein
MSTKTRIPFKNTSTLDGDGLPSGAETVTLFNSVTAFGARNMMNMGDHKWLTYSVAPSTNTTGNSVTADYSNDGGTTWINFYTSPTDEPVGDSTNFRDEVAIEEYQDVRLRFTNGALKQATLFAVNVALVAKERATAGI